MEDQAGCQAFESVSAGLAASQGCRFTASIPVVILALQVIRVVRFCSAFSLPIVSVLLPQKESLAGHCTAVADLANLVFAYGEAAVPKVSVLCCTDALAAEKVRNCKHCSMAPNHIAMA